MILTLLFWQFIIFQGNHLQKMQTQEFNQVFRTDIIEIFNFIKSGIVHPFRQHLLASTFVAEI